MCFSHWPKEIFELEKEVAELRKKNISLSTWRYLENLIVTYIQEHGGEANSMELGKYLAQQKPSRSISDPKMNALAELKMYYDSLTSFIERYPGIFVKKRIGDSTQYLFLLKDGMEDSPKRRLLLSPMGSGGSAPGSARGVKNTLTSSDVQLPGSFSGAPLNETSDALDEELPTQRMSSSTSSPGSSPTADLADDTHDMTVLSRF